MTVSSKASDDGTRGHFETSAKALLGVGSLGVVIGGTCLALGMTPPMLDAEGFLITGAIIAFVGLGLSVTRSE